VTEDVMKRIEDEIIRPTIEGLRAEDCEYRGVLYCGLMITESGPKVVEYNVRFGDPETQAVLPRLKSDIVPILLACAEGDLGDTKAEWTDNAAVCVVLASEGYPGKYEKGKTISGLNKAAGLPKTMVFHAGTAVKNKQIVTSGGRVLGATALAKDIPSAIARAYKCADAIEWAGKYCRRDIGKKAVARLGKVG
jgi:phosphoribosylamine--glycine ligase